jgi:hypothetical protein
MDLLLNIMGHVIDDSGTANRNLKIKFHLFYEKFDLYYKPMFGAGKMRYLENSQLICAA